MDDLPPRKIDYQMCLCVCALEYKCRSAYLIFLRIPRAGVQSKGSLIHKIVFIDIFAFAKIFSDPGLGIFLEGEP